MPLRDATAPRSVFVNGLIELIGKTTPYSRLDKLNIARLQLLNLDTHEPHHI